MVARAACPAARRRRWRTAWSARAIGRGARQGGLRDLDGVRGCGLAGALAERRLGFVALPLVGLAVAATLDLRAARGSPDVP